MRLCIAMNEKPAIYTKQIAHLYGANTLILSRIISVNQIISL